jgi:hypothetical protein
MIEITDFVAIHILTFEELFETFYGLIHLMARAPDFPDFNKGAENADLHIFLSFDLQRELSSTYVWTGLNGRLASITFSPKQDLLGSCIKEVVDVCNPIYILAPSLAPKRWEYEDRQWQQSWKLSNLPDLGELLYISDQRCAFDMNSKDIHLKFPSARKRLAISQYLISTLQKIHSTANKDTPNIELLLKSLEVGQQQSY